MNETEKQNLRTLLIDSIKNNYVITFKKIIQEIKDKYKDCSFISMDLVAIALEFNSSVEMVETILINDKYETLNYYYNNGGNRKLPLSYAIQKNNFEVADLLIEYGARLNNIPYYILKTVISPQNSKYLLDRDLEISLILINNLITDNIDFFLKQIFNYYFFNNSFILELLSYYKNKTPISRNHFEDKIKKEKEKILFDESLYEISVYNNNYNIMNLLIKYDSREKEIIINEIYKILCYREDSVQTQIIKNIKNTEIKQKLGEKISCKKNILELILANDTESLQKYLKEKEVQLLDFFEKTVKHQDLLKIAIDNNLSNGTIDFIIEQCKYDNLNYYVTMNGTSIPLLYFTIYQDKYRIFDFLLKKGADINFGNMLVHLNYDNIMNTKNLKYLLNSGYNLQSAVLEQIMERNDADVIDKIFNIYFYNNNYILKLLSLYKNKTPLSYSQLLSIITVERNKLGPKIDHLYQNAFKDEKYDMMSVLCRYDHREKNDILIDLFCLFNESEKKDELIDKIENKEIELPVDDYFLNNLKYSEDKIKVIKKMIKKEQLLELKNYMITNNILLPYYRTKYFDLLIYAIEKNASFDILKFMIHQYPYLNFTIEYNDNYWNDNDSISINDNVTSDNITNNENHHHHHYHHRNNNNHDEDDEDDDDDDSDDDDDNHRMNNSDDEDGIIIEEEEDDDDDDENIEEETTYISPLISALSINRFDIADILIEHGADINFSDVGHHLVDNDNINKQNLNYILKNNYTVTYDFIISLIENQSNRFLKDIFKFYVFNNECILKLLSMYQHKIPLSKKQLNDVILTQRYHVIVGFFWYKIAIGCHNNEAIDLFLEHSITSNQIFGEFENNGLLMKSINSNNFYFIKKLFNSTFLDINTLDIDNIDKLISFNSNDEEITEEDEAVIKEFIEKEDLINDSLIVYEDNLTVYEDDPPSISIQLDPVTYFINSLIQHPSFDFNKFKFEKILNVISNISEFYKIKFLIQKCLNHKTFDFANVDFKKVLAILENDYYIPLVEWMIDQAYRHPTFSLKKYNFESLLTTINYFRDADLLKYFIERSLYQNNFDFEHISIKKIFLYIGRIEEQPILEYYLNKLMGCMEFKMKYVNFDDLFITTSNFSENSNELLDYVNNKFLNDPSFDFSTEIKIETILVSLSKIENLYALEYYTDKILHHPTLDLQNPSTIEEILFTLCKIKNSVFVKSIIEKVFQLRKSIFSILNKVFKKNNRTDIDLKSVNNGKILALAKHYQNQILIDFINEYLKNTEE
ncbi:hypothetical protein PIROE2DRAFT_12906 [Piromyces sp. E2]|nr:hypothetical protein PIROE2DRAFT_12906 [Piromyces sp. E2]|eukprot:OUM61151.1 hypothetical protein PIROE2DRAFT_12906 [Piromyces sp. E2]